MTEVAGCDARASFVLAVVQGSRALASSLERPWLESLCFHFASSSSLCEGLCSETYAGGPPVFGISGIGIPRGRLFLGGMGPHGGASDAYLLP
jgi:hypothetical protein